MASMRLLRQVFQVVRVEYIEKGMICSIWAWKIILLYICKRNDLLNLDMGSYIIDSETNIRYTVDLASTH